MIKKINKIKNLGLVFSDFAWNSATPEFKKYNLIYGWNCSGKTTLSRLFTAIGGARIDGLEYEIVDEQNNRYSHSDVFRKKIRVFNREYIENNVRVQESNATPISVLLGEENKGLIEQIENDKKLLNGGAGDLGKIALINEKKQARAQKTRERDQKFTDIARTIGAALAGTAQRTYRKPDAERDFAQLTANANLTEKDVQNHLSVIRQDTKPEITPFALPKAKVKEGGDEIEVSVLLEAVINEGRELLQRTVESEVIAWLAANPDISEWVEQGLHLHNKHSSTVCEYCQQTLPRERLEQLAKHFNDADKRLKDSLDSLLDWLRTIYTAIESVQCPDKARFYTNLEANYETARASYVEAKDKILKEIKDLDDELKYKKSKTTESLILNSIPDVGVYLARLDEVNRHITGHNRMTMEHGRTKEEAIKRIKDHYLSAIYDEVTALDRDIARLPDTINFLNEEIAQIQSRIRENQAQVSSHHKACEILNEKLATFLGRQELTFVPHTGEDGEVAGFHIKRGDQLANYLSEGEKTAIAFIYFVVHLNDRDFDLADGIIVIDDPVSSLDTNSLYQAFSFLKNSTKDAHQVFILTHNFAFLRLLLNWRKHDGGSSTDYFMIKNNFSNDVRSASIVEMDKELRKYDSEYRYLFHLLKMMKNEQDDTIEKAYPIPNIARKVWDSFLSVTVPSTDSPYRKIEKLKEENFDAEKLDAIYKFTNDQSHITGDGFDPALVPEAKKVVNHIFEMMEKINPRHFKYLEEATN